MENKDQRQADRQYTFPNEDMIDKEKERKSEQVQAEKGPDEKKETK